MENASRFLLDRELFEDLKAYLEDKRSALRDALLFAISVQRSSGSPFLSDPNFNEDTFKFALSEFNRRSKNLTNKDLHNIDYERLVENISNILWNYVEILEGMCKELFEQLKTIPVDLWDSELYDRLESAKVFLWDKLKEIDSFLNTLEDSLKEFVLKCINTKTFAPFQKIRTQLHKILDPELSKRIKKAELDLHDKYSLFVKEFSFLHRAESKLVAEELKFEIYNTLLRLEPEKQRLYKRTWRLLKYWEGSKEAQKPLSEKFAYALKHTSTYGKVSVVFREYIKFMREVLFDFARLNRQNHNISGQAVIGLWRMELSTLKTVIEKYRIFLDDTEPNQKSFLGFRKKFQSKKSKELEHFKNEVVQIDKWLAELFESQDLSVEADLSYELARFRRADRLLLDMGQPLISRAVMNKRSHEFIKELQGSHELVTTFSEVSEMMLDTLLRAFKADTKHATLTEVKGFWPLWEVHHGLSYYNPSLNHSKRMKIYRRVVQHLKQWVSTQQLSQHVLGAEHDIHDIQEALQEFYHSIKDDVSVLEKWEFKKELLEERVFFSAFFAFLNKHEKDGKRLQAELSFVDKYFDAIYQRLSEIAVRNESQDENFEE